MLEVFNEPNRALSDPFSLHRRIFLRYCAIHVHVNSNAIDSDALLSEKTWPMQYTGLSTMKRCSEHVEARGGF